jgi:hypothetical protein
MAKKGPGRRAAEDKSDYLVFVSHATADKWIAKAFCEKIEATGAATFRDDRDIFGGDDIPEEIRGRILQAAEMVVVITPASVGRPWVLFEVGAFWGRRKEGRIVAVLCHVEYDTIPELIRSKKAININSFDEYLVELGQRVSRKKRR